MGESQEKKASNKAKAKPRQKKTHALLHATACGPTIGITRDCEGRRANYSEREGTKNPLNRDGAEGFLIASDKCQTGTETSSPNSADAVASSRRIKFARIRSS